jgi:hypothetical protein
MTNLEVVVKVPPFGIHAVDEIDLLGPGTGLDLLLSGNGGVGVIRDGIVHELANVSLLVNPGSDFSRC